MDQTRLKKHIPNILTFSNMSLGLIAIFTIIHNSSLRNRRLACILILLAVIVDFLDGFSARCFDAVSEMGAQLDSFADIITFGLAPIAIFSSNLNHIRWYIMIILLIYTLAGAFRLARYNLMGNSDYFMGLPITCSGCILVAVLLISSYFISDFTKSFINFFLLLTLSLSLMMISKFRVNRII